MPVSREFFYVHVEYSYFVNVEYNIRIYMKHAGIV